MSTHFFDYHCPECGFESDVRTEGMCPKCGDGEICMKPDPTDFTDYSGPRGGEAAAELAHRQEQARRLK
jgi:hypothetical protein